MHEITLTVRGYELDSYGHVNNAVFLQYMEQARWELFRSSGLLGPLEKKGMKVVVIEATVRYQREARLFDNLLVQTRCRKAEPFMVFDHRIVRTSDHLTLARGKIKTVPLDHNRMVTDIPEELDTLFEP